MASVARQIVEQRDFSFRAEKMTDDEIGVVTDAFNKMLDEVQAHARALETSEKLYRLCKEKDWTMQELKIEALSMEDAFLKATGHEKLK